MWEGSPAKALLALEAVRFLLGCRGQQIRHSDGRQINYETLMEMEKRLSAYVSQTSTTARANRAAFTRGVMKV